MTVLEIELDLLALQACLLQEKFDCIAALLETWSTKKHCTHNELESLFRNLQQACKVIPQGHTLLWYMMNLLSAFWRDDHPIRLNQEFPLDLSWWGKIFLAWDGLAFSSPLWYPS